MGCFVGRWGVGRRCFFAFGFWLRHMLRRRREVRGRHGEVWRWIDVRMLRWCKEDGGRWRKEWKFCERSIVSGMLSVESDVLKMD